MNELIGIVQNGRFLPLTGVTIGAQVQLTTIQRQEARSPDSSLLDLRPYEGQAIMVSGYLDSGWLYSAGVKDRAGPILTAVVKKVFGDALPGAL